MRGPRVYTFFILILLSICFQALADGLTVRFQVNSADGCYSSPNGNNIDLYNECTILECQERYNQLADGCPRPCDDEDYRDLIVNVCQEQVSGFNRISNACPVGSLQQEIDMSDEGSRVSLQYSMGICQSSLRTELPGRPVSFYRSSCRALLASRRDNYANVVAGIFRLDPKNIDNMFTNLQVQCQEADSGLLNMEFTLPGGQSVNVNLFEPEENRYENGCFQRLPPAALSAPEYQHFKSYVPVRNNFQYLETPDSIPVGPHDLNQRAAAGTLLIRKLVHGDDNLESTVEFNLSGNPYDSASCMFTGLCGRRSNPIGLQTFNVRGQGSIVLPGLGPETTPRICQSLVAGASRCWQIHNDMLLYAEAMLMMVGAFEGIGVVNAMSKVRTVARPRRRPMSRASAGRVLTRPVPRPKASRTARNNARSRLRRKLNLDEQAFARRFPCAR